MRAALERFARRIWRNEAGWLGTAIGWLLWPAEMAWRFVAGRLNRRWDREGGAQVAGLEVISVGNVAVGGTGKTPFASWLARELAGLGRRPALLVRGYGDDEVRLHRRWTPDVRVVVDPDRVEGARSAREGGADMAVLDDGFQHRRLARRLDVVLLAAADPVPGPVLPRGPYREPLEGLRRADVVVVTLRGEPVAAAQERLRALRTHGWLADGVQTGCVRFETVDAVPIAEWAGRQGVDDEGAVGGQEPRRSSGDGLPGQGAPTVVAATGIARPDAFRANVEAWTGARAELAAYADHHEFSSADVQTLAVLARGRPVYVTEKDAVKLVEHVDRLPRVMVVRQRMVWEMGEVEVRRRLAALFAPSGEGHP